MGANASEIKRATTQEWHAHSRLKVETGLPSGPGLPSWELAMDNIAKANIDRFNRLLETEADPAKRAMLMRLLSEEEAKQRTAREEKQG